MKHKGYLMNFIWIFLLISSCNKKINSEIDHSEKETFQFTEIGRKAIPELKFPNYWNTQVYSDSEALPMTKEARYYEDKLNDLDYFESIKGRLTKTKIYDHLLTEKNQIVDSLFILDSISNKNTSFIYIKSYKTETGNYEFPPKFKEIDLLIFSDSKFKRKVNIYSYRDYPYAVGMRLGYLNRDGDLYLKEFEVDEEKTAFVKEEHLQISKDGNVKKISSNIPTANKKNIPQEKRTSSNNYNGQYSIDAKAASYANKEEITLGYVLTLKSQKLAILSINAEHSEDYWCEGPYTLTKENDVLHAKGKCDQNDDDDFYLKFENGKAFIKSKRFIDKDWQKLKKE